MGDIDGDGEGGEPVAVALVDPHEGDRRGDSEEEEGDAGGRGRGLRVQDVQPRVRLVPGPRRPQHEPQSRQIPRPGRDEEEDDDNDADAAEARVLHMRARVFDGPGARGPHAAPQGRDGGFGVGGDDGGCEAGRGRVRFEPTPHVGG